MYSFFVFIFIFGSIVFFHELGHYLFAKRAGILCREFAIGFGPKIFSFRKNETLFTIRILPLGGFVSMAGEDGDYLSIKPGQNVGLLLNQNSKVTKIFLDNISNYKDITVVEVDDVDLEDKLYIKTYDHISNTSHYYYCINNAVIVENSQETQIAPKNRHFKSKSAKDKFLTIFAGPFFNFIFAFLIILVTALWIGHPTNQINKIIDQSPAEFYNLKEGDIIKKINGNTINSWSEIQKSVSENPGKYITLSIERNNTEKVISLKIDEKTTSMQNNSIKTGYIGIEPAYTHSIKQAFKASGERVYTYSALIVQSLKDLLTGTLSWKNLSGPVGIYEVTDKVTQLGVLNVINFAAFISINLGIMNLLPIPALDGGRILIIFLEAIRGRSLNTKTESIINLAGFCILMLVMLLITWKDIMNMV